MKFELITSLDERAKPAINWQIEQVKKGLADRLLLFQPHEDAKNICQVLGLPLDRVFDMASQQLLSDWPDGDGQFLFDLFVPNQGRIHLGDDGTVNLSSAGKRIADVMLFADSYYLVQAIAWLDQDGQISRKEIFLRSGQLFAKQYFNRASLLQSDFYFGQKRALRSDFYFSGRRNFALVNGDEYPSYEAAEQDLLAVYAKDQTVEITSAGILSTIAKASTLALPEGLFTQDEKIPKDVLTILQNPSHPVKTVKVNPLDYQRAKELGVPTDKLRVESF
ncbi:hypothetical protein LQZ24_00520 [Fructobacillus sp. M1-13]|uniref:Uncharacterized protein n=1 Tax=Fructobacillus papyriferae TaxID=2713171 RepID=A0ABS5QN64_9LACO|nr:hypothetical protein [Fructobacillus papyriferae]MBS9334523.1 hypothetical protein [Fructobacillus papyriferae]MCD2158512.1 hypothetical protein [Fructobacillus papyriferae]